MADHITAAFQQPLARTAITLAGVSGVCAGWVGGGRRSLAALRLSDAGHLAKVHVRADPDTVFANTLGVGLGRSRRRGDGTLVVGSGPGEWMLVGSVGAAGALLREVHDGAGSQFVTAVDLTHGRALMRLTGQSAARTLAKVCAIDLADTTTPEGSALRTAVARVSTDLVRDDSGCSDGLPSYLLHCERSSGQYLFDCLLDAGAEFGVEPEGPDLDRS